MAGDIGLMSFLQPALNLVGQFLPAIRTPPVWDGFSLKQSVYEYEAHVIAAALKEAKGSVSAASRLLGFKHHQSIISLLNTRHKHLLKARKKIRKRRRHLMNHKTKRH